jgi:hypothetical protein
MKLLQSGQPNERRCARRGVAVERHADRDVSVRVHSAGFIVLAVMAEGCGDLVRS